MPVSLHDIQQAAELLSGNIVRTPLVPASRLSAMFDAEVYLKLENMQYTGSFKDRGSFVKLSSLTDEERKAGVIAMSAGNHAQGVAFHAKRMGIPATIVMPITAPFTKVERTKSFGARVEQYGTTLDESKEVADRLQAEGGLAFVHPFDDEKVVAGQGTIGLEILEDLPDVEEVVVPIGGGGIISGIATAMKALKPGVTMTGAQCSFYPSMYQAMSGIEAQMGGQTLADGIAVKNPGGITQEIVSRLVDHIEVVEENLIELAILRLAEEARVISEGAGASGLAAMLKDPTRYKGKKVAVVICGGNIDTQLYANVLRRGLIADQRIVRLRVSILDIPGVLSKMAAIIGENRGNIIDVAHQRYLSDIPAKNAELDITIETPNSSAIIAIRAALNDAGFPNRRLRDQMAKDLVTGEQH